MLRVPESVPPEAYFAGLLASALVVVAGATTLFLTCVLFVRTSGTPAHLDRYTLAGRGFIHPEHETAFFLAACALSVALVLAQTIWWNRRLRRTAAVPGRATVFGLAVVAGCGVGAAAGGLLAFFVGRHYVARHLPTPWVAPAVLLVVVGCCGVVGAAGVRSRFAWYPRWLTSAESSETPPQRGRPVILDALTPLFVIAVLFVPAGRILAGRAYQIDQLIHWDYFSMGATTAFVHGAALGSQVHVQYGIGWPVFFGLLKPLVPVSYGHMVLLSSVILSLYFIGVYLLLRMVTGRAAWAATGTLLALWLQVFSGNYQSLATNVLHFPSISVMRRPFDVWVFLALALHLRSKRPVWAVTAGLLTGLAVVFSTDTGLYLAAAFGVYWACVGMMEGRAQVRWFAASMAAALGAFLAVMGIGSRWTLFSVSFWKSWFEPIAQGAAGYTALPLVGRADIWGLELPGRGVLAALVAIAVVYLLVVCHLVIKVAHRRAASPDVLLGSVSAYGLLCLISFVGRSDALELPHVLVPFAIVVTVLAARGHRRLTRRTPRRAALVPFLLAGVLGITLGFNPSFRHYPGLLHDLVRPSPPDGRCLMTAPHDVCGLPATFDREIQQFAVVTADMRRLAATGRVALIDFQEAYNVGADLATWGEHAPLLPVLFEHRQVRAAMAQLLQDRPAYVFIRPVAAYPPYVVDSAQAFVDLLQRTYALDHTVGTFLVYKVR